MTKKEFMNKVANGEVDILQQFLDLLAELEIDYCVIGGLAVNAYAEPVVSLDLDLIITTADLGKLRPIAGRLFTVKEFPHSLNLESPRSDLRIQLQTDRRYQSFLSKATRKKVMGYEMRVATLEDILQGKVWAYSDKDRRASKRQKDLADIFRLIETYPYLKGSLPASIQEKTLG